MFESSGNLTTCLAIYPNSTDDWTSTSPFNGEVLDTGGELTYVDDDTQPGFAQRKG